MHRVPGVLVYGDPRQVEAVREKAERIRAGARALTADPPGIARHARLAGLLVEAGELAQGLLDAQPAQAGSEQPGELSDQADRLCLDFAEALLRSLSTLAGAPPLGPHHAAAEAATAAEAPPLPALEGPLDALLALARPHEIEVRVPEGYAFYGLYPESYLAAGVQWRHDIAAGDGPPPHVHVIGIRSIGTSLAAAVAAALGSPVRSTGLALAAGSPGAADRSLSGWSAAFTGGPQRPGEIDAETGGRAVVSLSTVRPAGHPFDRRLELPSRAAARLLEPPGALYAVVDEGPGLSGSSFGSVADWLEDRGVSSQAIAFFPSHRGPLGPQASERHRQRWERARRLTVDFEDLFLRDPAAPLHLARWAEDITGAAQAPLEDLGAGAWRSLLYPDETCWPAVHTQGERRKYLLTSARGRWLLKFVGLGRYGEEALARAGALQGAGLVPPVAGLRHGFLVGPWLEGARPLPLAQIDRGRLVEGVARHLAFLAGRFPVPSGREGASPTRLLEMAEYNATRALGAGDAEPLRAWRERLPELHALARPVLSDNRPHAWEWLVLPDGRLLKADALDHHRGNDLVGPQDPAWDLAAAAVELDLTHEEQVALVERFARRKRPPHPLQLAFYTSAYLAFELGRTTLAAEALAGTDPAEATRLRAAANRHAERLRAAIQTGCTVRPG